MDGYRINILAVGQGNGNLIELYDNYELIQLVLFDYGSEDYYDITLEQVADLMRARGTRAKAEGITEKDYYLDYLIISHQDLDHYNLMDSLLSSHPGRLEIGSFAAFQKDLYIVSSTYNTFYDRAVHAAKKTIIISNGSGIQEDGSIQPFYSLNFADDVYFRLYCLCANSLYPGKGWNTGFRKNSLSAVIGCECKTAGEPVLRGTFTADATVYTMSLINTTIHGLLPRQEFATAPHHGSVTTSCDRPNHYDERINLHGFLTRMNAVLLIISAGAVSQHGHPHSKFMSTAREVQAGEDVGVETYQSKYDKGHYPPYDSFTLQAERGIESLCSNCFTELSQFPEQMQQEPALSTQKTKWVTALNRYARHEAEFDDIYCDSGNIPPFPGYDRMKKNVPQMVTAMPGSRLRQEEV